MWESDIINKSLNFSLEKLMSEDYMMSLPDCQNETRLMMMMIHPDLFYPSPIPCSMASSSLGSTGDFFSSTNGSEDMIFDNSTTMNSTSPSTILSPPLRPPVVISFFSRSCIITHCLLFILGALGNTSVFTTVAQELWRKGPRSRIKVLILHLSIADLFVIFFVIPIEIFWRITVIWHGGNVLCKISQFFRAFPLYLSSNVIICISLDRFYVIISPLKVIGGMRRVKNMLIVAWLCAITLATPQSVVFSVQTIALYKNPQLNYNTTLYVTYKQCVNFHYFESVEDETLYSFISVSAMYFAPLTVILFTYVGVLIKVTRRSRHHQNVSEFQRRILQQRFTVVGGSVAREGTVNSPANTTTTSFANNNCNGSPDLMMTSRILLKRTFTRRNLRGQAVNETTDIGTVVSTSSSTNSPGLTASTHRRGSQFLRMSSNAHNITKSRRHAFFLTLTIITTFVICWTPFVIMTLWSMFDWESAKMVDERVQQAFFIMAISNSCINPILYGNICCRRRPTPNVASDDQRSGNRRETCDTG